MQLLAAALIAPATAGASTTELAAYGDLPPALGSVDPVAEQTLLLEFIVNGLRTGIVAPVLTDHGRYQLRLADLKRAGLLIDAPGETLFLDEMPGVNATYDAPAQQLRITVPAGHLPAQRVARARADFKPAQYDMGALLNYDVYVSGGGDAPTRASLWHEARVFGQAGLFSTTGVLSTGVRRTYVRYDTSWRWSNEEAMITLEAGDLITRSLPWAPAVRLGGFQASRDFSIRPDVITYPLPEFAGTAALPSTVELVVGGQRIAGGAVNPGPFALDTLPPINGAGEANLIVTDMHGRSISTAMPFYVSSALLRPGLTDYAVAFGAFRRNYGRANFDYGGYAGTTSLRRGITNSVTLEVRAEIADDMQLAGGGAVVKLGAGGILSGSYSRSFHRGDQGGQLTIGYEYQARLFSIALRHSRQDGDYVDLGLIDRIAEQRARRLSAATFSVSLGRAGTLGLGYFDIESEGGFDSRLANASWSLPLWEGSRLNASASREFNDKSWSGALSFSVPLGGRAGTLSAGVAQAPGGVRSWRADFARATPSNGGLGWSASALGEEGGGLFLRGDMSLRTDLIQLRAGAYGRDEVTAWAGASGSLVVMDSALFAANRVADAFVVVSTNGEPDIPVRYENQLIGHTNRNGQLLIPSASAYYPGQYAIDPLGLPANVKVPAVSQRIAVAAGSGLVVRFPIERMRAARAILKGPDGSPIAAGASALINRTATTYVGWDGLLFLEDIAAKNEVTVTLADGSRCSLRFAAPLMSTETATDNIVDLGELICRPQDV